MEGPEVEYRAHTLRACHDSPPRSVLFLQLPYFHDNRNIEGVNVFRVAVDTRLGKCYRPSTIPYPDKNRRRALLSGYRAGSTIPLTMYFVVMFFASFRMSKEGRK